MAVAHRMRGGVAHGSRRTSPTSSSSGETTSGSTNLSCYSDGLMGYRTPNIDRIADEGMRFTDSYGEQSCTAGRSSFITGQSVLPDRAEQGRHARRRRRAAAPRTRRSPSCSSRSATRPGSSARTTSATGTSTCRRCTGSTSSSATSTTSTPRRSRSRRTTRRQEDFPRFRERFGPRGVLHSWATDEDDATERGRWGRVGKQRIEDTGPLTKKRMETIDDEVLEPRRRLHRAPARGRHAVLRVVQHDAHALPHPPEAREPRAGRALAVAVPRHDDRPRQGRRRAARPARRARHRRGHDRHLQHRQRAAHEHVARRRDDAVPQREEHELGGRVPRAGDGPLARQDPGRGRLERDRPAPRLAADVPRRRRRARHRREAEDRATRPATRRSRSTSTATTCCRT